LHPSWYAGPGVSPLAAGPELKLAGVAGRISLTPLGRGDAVGVADAGHPRGSPTTIPDSGCKTFDRAVGGPPRRGRRGGAELVVEGDMMVPAAGPVPAPGSADEKAVQRR